MTKHLVVRRVHHNLRVHRNGEVDRIALTSHAVGVGRGDGEVCYNRRARGIRHREFVNLSIATCCQTDRRFVIRPCVTHAAIGDCSRECHFRKLRAVTELSALRCVHHHGGVHRNCHGKRITHTDVTCFRGHRIDRILNCVCRIGQSTVHIILCRSRSFAACNVGHSRFRPSVGGSEGAVYRSDRGGRERGAATNIGIGNRLKDIVGIRAVQGHRHRQRSLTA